MRPGSKRIQPLNGGAYYLAPGDLVEVPHKVVNPSGHGYTLARRQGRVVFLHPELRLAVVEIEFPPACARREPVKIRETYYMEMIRKVRGKKCA